MNIRAGHMFWQTPPAARQLRTVPLGRGSRPILLGTGLFAMAQASGNRLDQVSIPAIIGRIQLVPAVQAYLAAADARSAGLRGRGLGLGLGLGLGMANLPPRPPPPPSFPPMTAQEAQILFEISKNPSSEELEDLATIDNLFSQNFTDAFTTTNEVCFLASQPDRSFGRFAQVQPATGEAALISYLNPAPVQTGRWAPQPPPPPDTEFLDEKFWCPDPDSMGPSTFQAYLPVSGRFTSFAAMFGIDPNRTWGEVKLATKNGLIMLDVKVSYPLPPILDMAPDFVWNMAASPHLAEMANIGATVDPEVFRMWYTMEVLLNFDAAEDAIIREQKRKAKKAKRKAIIKGVAIALAGIVLSFILPAIIAAAITAIKSAVDLYIAAKERQKAAKAMAEAARMFEADAPAFANEVQKTADMLDSAAAQAEADRPLTQEELDALQEVKDNPEPGQMTDAGTLLVGGVAATGIVAALIALFK